MLSSFGPRFFITRHHIVVYLSPAPGLVSLQILVVITNNTCGFSLCSRCRSLPSCRREEHWFALSATPDILPLRRIKPRIDMALSNSPVLSSSSSFEVTRVSRVYQPTKPHPYIHFRHLSGTGQLYDTV